MTDLRSADNLEEVRAYFDQRASGWDERQHPDPEVIEDILKKGKVGGRVLDVACGTGVMIPFYIKAGVRSVVGVDLSPKMIEEAEKKFEGKKKVSFLALDALEAEFEEPFDTVVVFNAWPHFIQPLKAISAFAGDLRPGGRLVIAHDKGRKQLDNIHRGGAPFLSLPLPPASLLAERMEGWLKVEEERDLEDRYEVVGKKIA
ncbi:MAG: class I SAM-dependent methyltransferase [Bifidobacteriaceae bacterium]|nr:class I SAM-dependent methyltransferase [Aeriscardovia sp.]MBQ1804135.1 class I SAM-dependent methyltransferase [Bifidobacteriaceae bacterium]